MSFKMAVDLIVMGLFVLFCLFVLVCVLRTPRQRKPWTPPEGYMLEPSTSQCTMT